MKAWLAAAWRGMGVWKWVGIAAIITVILLTPETARGHHQQAGPLWERPPGRDPSPELANRARAGAPTQDLPVAV